MLKRFFGDLPRVRTVFFVLAVALSAAGVNMVFLDAETTPPYIFTAQEWSLMSLVPLALLALATAMLINTFQKRPLELLFLIGLPAYVLGLVLFAIWSALIDGRMPTPAEFLGMMLGPLVFLEAVPVVLLFPAIILGILVGIVARGIYRFFFNRRSLRSLLD